MKSKLVITSAAALLAGTLYAAAQGAPGGQPQNPQTESFPANQRQMTRPAPAPRPQEQGTVGQGFRQEQPNHEQIQPRQPNGRPASEAPDGLPIGS